MTSRLSCHWDSRCNWDHRRTTRPHHSVTKIMKGKLPVPSPSSFSHCFHNKSPRGMALMEGLCEYQVSMAVVNGC